MRSSRFVSPAAVIALALASTVLAGCSSKVPVGEFERFSLAMGGLQDIARNADAELEDLALDALVAKSRKDTLLRAENLDPATRWSGLWTLVDARHATLEFVESYVDLLLVWADLARERPVWSTWRILSGNDGEEIMLRTAENQMSFNAKRIPVEVEGVDAVQVANARAAINALVAVVAETIEDVENGVGRRANTDRLGMLMTAAQSHVDVLASLTGSIETQITRQIDDMTDIILDNANAARPPSYLPERLEFDETVILRMARANRLKRVSWLLSEAFNQVAPAHQELNDVRERIPKGDHLPALQRLYADVERGPERIRGEERIPELPFPTRQIEPLPDLMQNKMRKKERREMQDF